MAKTRAKTPAAAAVAAAAAQEKSAETLPVQPAEPARALTYPYLLSLETLREIFGSSDTAAAAATTTTAHKQRLLQQALGVAHCDTNPRSAAWVDWCFDVLCFARSREGSSEGVAGAGGFATDGGGDNDEKTLLALTIADEIFQFAVSPLSSSDGTYCQPTLEQCYERFRARVREVSSAPLVAAEAAVAATVNDYSGTSNDEQPPEQQQKQPPAPRPPTLSMREVASFVSFMSATLFRHLAAYQYVHRHTRASVTRTIELCVEAPFPPAALASATQLAESVDSDRHEHDDAHRNENSGDSA